MHAGKAPTAPALFKIGLVIKKVSQKNEGRIPAFSPPGKALSLGFDENPIIAYPVASETITYYI
jgi:hypothetical protein